MGEGANLSLSPPLTPPSKRRLTRPGGKNAWALNDLFPLPPSLFPPSARGGGGGGEKGERERKRREEKRFFFLFFSEPTNSGEPRESVAF